MKACAVNQSEAGTCALDAPDACARFVRQRAQRDARFSFHPGPGGHSRRRVVGWVCQRIGLSMIVGFLVAGHAVGPHTPPIALVADVERVDTLAQIGLVFLIPGSC